MADNILDWAVPPSRTGSVGLRLIAEAQSADSGAPPQLDSWSLNDKAAYMLGRNGQAVDVFVAHKSASRVHACLAYDDRGDLFLVDLGSAHGTVLNGKRLTKHDRARVSAGDVFTIAACPVVYRLEAHAAAAEPRSRWEDSDAAEEAVQPGHARERSTHASGRNEEQQRHGHRHSGRPGSPDAERGRGRSRSMERAQAASAERPPGHGRSRGDRQHGRRDDRAVTDRAAVSHGLHERRLPPSRQPSPVPRRSSPRRRKIERHDDQAAEEQRKRQAAFRESLAAKPAPAPAPAADPAAIVRSMMGLAAGATSGGTSVDVAQKKKLLWGAKKAAVPETGAQVGANRWDTAEFTSDADKSKFQRLMGVKQVPTVAAEQESPELFDRHLPQREQQERLQGDLERSFLEGVKRGNRHTVGLGL